MKQVCPKDTLRTVLVKYQQRRAKQGKVTAEKSGPVLGALSTTSHRNLTPKECETQEQLIPKLTIGISSWASETTRTSQTDKSWALTRPVDLRISTGIMQTSEVNKRDESPAATTGIYACCTNVVLCVLQHSHSENTKKHDFCVMVVGFLR